MYLRHYLRHKESSDKSECSSGRMSENGMVKCAHGILPVPAPATAYILQSIPTYAGNMEGELCTPTGAALLKHFVHSFEVMPTTTTQKIGYGMDAKTFRQRIVYVRFWAKCRMMGKWQN